MANIVRFPLRIYLDSDNFSQSFQLLANILVQIITTSCLDYCYYFYLISLLLYGLFFIKKSEGVPCQSSNILALISSSLCLCPRPQPWPFPDCDSHPRPSVRDYWAPIFSYLNPIFNYSFCPCKLPCIFLSKHKLGPPKSKGRGTYDSLLRTSKLCFTL